MTSKKVAVYIEHKLGGSKVCAHLKRINILTVKIHSFNILDTL